MFAFAKYTPLKCTLHTPAKVLVQDMSIQAGIRTQCRRFSRSHLLPHVLGDGVERAAAAQAVVAGRHHEAVLQVHTQKHTHKKTTHTHTHTQKKHPCHLAKQAQSTWQAMKTDQRMPMKQAMHMA